MEFGSSNHLRKLFHVGWLDVYNVEALVGNFQVPQIDAEIICRQIRFLIRVDRDAIDVVGMRVGKDSSWRRFHHQIHWFDAGHSQSSNYGWIPDATVFLLTIIAFYALVALRNFPQFYRFVVGAEQEVGLILALQPSNLVDFLLDF